MSASRTARIAVLGAGPSGLYAAEALVRDEEVAVQVDVLDRLPTPYGLVRYGVAPDHPRIKSIQATLQRVLEHPRVRFVGGVDIVPPPDAAAPPVIGHDLLLSCYDAVVWATGASADKRLGVPGEDLPGSYPATTFVAWYCGHPDAAQPFGLDVSAVAVVGVGNVAVDVARLLARPVADLEGTDVPEPVLAELRRSAVTTVHLIGRRGPQFARWTTKELRELGQLDGVDVVVDPADLEDAVDGGERHVRANLEVLRGWAAREPTGAPRRIELHFGLSPVQILGGDRVTGLRLRGQVPPGGGDPVEVVLDVDLVLRAVGYRSLPVPGVPFDEHSGVVPSEAGRVTGPGGHVAGEYVAGWLKRGPTGVIGTNRSDAAETVRSLLEDLRGQGPRHAAEPPDLVDVLRHNGIGIVDYPGWLAIDAGERQRGSDGGREREKIADWQSLRRLSGLESPPPT